MALADGALRINEIVIQYNRVEDRAPEEITAAAQGYLPLMVRADDFGAIYLLRARAKDLELALAAAGRAEKSAPNANRRKLVEGMAEAIESNFAFEEAAKHFVSGALLLFAEGLAQQGCKNAAEIAPCAVHVLRDRPQALRVSGPNS